jgi:hypothetical protein
VVLWLFSMALSRGSLLTWSEVPLVVLVVYVESTVLVAHKCLSSGSAVALRLEARHLSTGRRLLTAWRRRPLAYLWTAWAPRVEEAARKVPPSCSCSISSPHVAALTATDRGRHLAYMGTDADL